MYIILEGTKNKTSKKHVFMKNHYFTLTLLFAACLATTACEKAKEKNCDSYLPWPSSEAMAAWTDYSPELVNDWDSYNDVSTTIDFFGLRFRAYDSILVRHKKDTVLLCGYLKTGGWYEEYGLYWLVSDPFAPISPYNSVQVNFGHPPRIQNIDTTRKAYLIATPRVGTVEQFLKQYPTNGWALSSCSEYEYTFSGKEITKYE